MRGQDKDGCASTHDGCDAADIMEEPVNVFRDKGDGQQAGRVEGAAPQETLLLYRAFHKTAEGRKEQCDDAGADNKA